MATATTNALLDAALAYAARGWKVFPCRGKKPITKKGLLVASTDPAVITRWWTDHPRANIGWALGDGIWALDVDARHDGPDTLADLERAYSALPRTVTNLTGSGGGSCHLLWRGEVKNKAELGEGLDVQGPGSYIIVPPSVHPDTRNLYCWEDDFGPDDLEVQATPDWLLALCQEPTPRPARPPSPTKHEVPTEAYAAELLSYVPNPGASRDRWLDMGMALHSTDADWAFALWDAWSQQYPEKYDARHQTKAWDSFSLDGPAGKSPITFGTLVFVAKANGYQRRNGETPGPDGRPETIILSTAMTEVVDAAEAALLGLPNAPVLFQRARRICTIAYGGIPPKWLRRPPDMPLIAQASPGHLRERMSQAAAWRKKDKRSKTYEPALPAGWVVESLLGRPSWDFPPLEGILCAPTLRPDGSVLNQPGYDPETGLYFESNGTTFPEVPAHPDIFDAQQALGALLEVVKDFPFAQPCHRAGWLSAVLSLVCRHTIQGCVPLHGITATTRGSGKTLLADTIALIGTGHPAARWSQVFDEDEERKRMLSLALDGDPLVCIDNVTAPLASGVLALALTGLSFKDRLLGVNETREAPLSAVFLCTGNNVQYGGDVERRVIPIAIDPVMERPEERTGFTHQNLLAWVLQERPRLTTHALTLVKAYCEAGCPAQELTPYGSFEAWSDLIRQTLVWVGEADPWEGRKDLEAGSTPEFDALAVLLHAWHACYKSEAVALRKVEEDCAHLMQHVGPGTTANEWNALSAALMACDKRSDGKQFNATRIGQALRRWQGRVIDGKRLLTLPIKASGGIALWKVDGLPSA